MGDKSTTVVVGSPFSRPKTSIDPVVPKLGQANRRNVAVVGTGDPDRQLPRRRLIGFPGVLRAGWGVLFKSSGRRTTPVAVPPAPSAGHHESCVGCRLIPNPVEIPKPSSFSLVWCGFNDGYANVC